jgi:hypothetical protein
VEKAGSGNTLNPMLDDPVKVLPGIGPETLGKLLDIGATATARGHVVPFSCISTGEKTWWQLEQMSKEARDI